MARGSSFAFEQRARGFGPIIDDRVRVLILGSLPGQTSLIAGRYYAHPQNQFWKLVGSVIGMSLEAMAYDERLNQLLQNHVGLWDSVAEAYRPGSLDRDLSDIRHNDLLTLTSRLPALRLVAFNGQAAARIGQKALSQPQPSVATVTLPSSSAAHTLAFPRKLDLWRAALAPALHP